MSTPTIEAVIDELIRLRDVDLERTAELERRTAELEAAAAARWWHRPARWLRWIAGAPA